MADPEPTPPPLDAPAAMPAPEPDPQAIPPTDPPVRPQRVLAELGRPFQWGFLATVGALVALGLSGALSSLSEILVMIGAALFIALALDPLVAWLERHHMSRGLGIAVVFAGFALVIGGLLALVIPVAVVQISQFASSVPTYITSVRDSQWFTTLITSTGQADLYQTLLTQAQSWLSNPVNLLTIGGGALAVGTGLVNGVSATLIVLILTLYFLASLRTMKAAMVRISPAYARQRLRTLIEQIGEAVGGYVSGMVILAACNAVFAFILLSILGVPFAALLAVCALAITMIPMVGPVLFWLLATSVALFTSWWAGLLFAGIYFAYMQVEAYLMTPRVMTKAVDIPGSLVLIGALIGATLLGLLGALVAVPVTASLLMLVRDVWIPKQDRSVVAPL